MLVNNEIRNQDEQLPNSRRYSPEFKIFAFYIFSSSPKTYFKLAQFFSWPSRSVLIREQDEELMNTGLSKSMINYLDELIILKDQPSSLVLDEVSLKPFLSYDNNAGEVQGKTDLGDLGTSGKVAKYSLTFMISSPLNKIKMPLCFFFSASQVSGHNLEQITKSIIRKLFRIRIPIVLLIFDQGSSNLKLFRTLCTNPDQPFFNLDLKLNESESIVHTVHVLFDIPHVFKAIRNNLISYPLKFKDLNDNEQIANWSYIQQTFFIDQKQSISMIPKIKYKHVFPTSFQKMKVNILDLNKF